MSGLNVFLKENKKKIENVKIRASKSFLDEEGNPIEWEIRSLKSKEAEEIRKECTSISAKGKRVDVDSGKFNRLVSTRCTVFPNLNDKELQDSYGVMGAEALITELLDNDGEYQTYCKEVMKISGYLDNFEDLVEEAKN